MTVSLDLRVTELLASRICHDLISPVGAINNGVELLEEMGAQVGEEAVKLIGHSADMASRRLRLFRLCYGAAGADSNLSADDVLTTMRDYISGSRVSITWTPEKMKVSPLPKGGAKVLLNLVIIAYEALVHGGSIDVTLAADNPSKINIMATGRGAGQREEAWAPLQGSVQVTDLSAKTVHPYVTGQFARQYGVQVAHQIAAEDRIEITLAPASAAAAA